MITRMAVAELVGSIRNEHWKGTQWDHEAAHADEDAIHQLVLTAIADGDCEDPAGCARMAMKTKQWDFQRWYA